MLYYVYILGGPLKGITIPLPPNHYSFFLQNEEYNDNKEENEKTSIYIPCNSQKCKKKLSIILDGDNIGNNKYKIESSFVQNEIGNEYPLILDEPIYTNDIPIFLVSDQSHLRLDSSHFKKKKNKWVINKKIGTLLIFIILFFIVFFFYTNRSLKEKNTEIVSKSLNFKGFKGDNGYYCIYDDLYPTLNPKNNLENNVFYIDRKKIEHLLIDNKYKKTHLILKNKDQPIINFIYHNENEKSKIISTINNLFSEHCHPIINGISIPNIINDINKLELSKTISYTIEEKNSRLTLIFDDLLNSNNKQKLDTYIKKQTAIFGRKFIFYRENISNPILKNKATLQEDRGYIFLDNQHRYFPQG
ncbi:MULTISPECIES: hypothetical protein [Proteus]|jgi:hypothetical protein|uniref:Type III secretion system protein PrgH-EprH (PrgH) n=1 Tax=Proteus vulgaris TaxID=585 RepID=A0A379F9Y0_PROVU|nr:MULTISPECIES: hypothetical protein [Proteus]AYY82075.1 hypothetical protein EGX81_14835 [Proteus vulgaris]KGA57188.1 type III secretion system PrgH-EprH family protein [Proteus vulgaris]MBG5970262.1 hypothetical protein [Proteus vulgaris]MBG5985681.1 hypothetical protein [Proteus vulgaris]MBI6511615.1 hypothetical protein [Proteus sp. PR00174]